MKYYNIQNESIWTEDDMKEAYNSYVLNGGNDNYDEYVDNMLDQDFEKIDRSEYAVEVYDDDDGFEYQIDVFETLEEATEYIENNNDCDEDEYYVINCIEYDEYENEVAFYSVY